MNRERFDWSQDNPDVVFRSYGDLAMHLNPYGDIVIRQKDDGYDTEDAVVIVPIANADVFLARFKELAEESTQYDWRPEGEPNATLPAQPQTDRQQKLALPAPLNGKCQRVGASNG